MDRLIELEIHKHPRSMQLFQILTRKIADTESPPEEYEQRIQKILNYKVKKPK